MFLFRMRFKCSFDFFTILDLQRSEFPLRINCPKNGERIHLLGINLYEIKKLKNIYICKYIYIIFF